MASTNYLDYPVGSPERAQLQAAEQQANLASAQQEMARATTNRAQLASLSQAESAQRTREAQERRHPTTPEPGFMGRIGDLFIRGVGKSAEAFAGLAYDIGRAAVRDDTRVLDVLPGALAARAGQELNAWFGPRGMGGSLIGLIPTGARAAIQPFAASTGEALNAVRREALVEPAARLLTGHNPFGGLSDLGGYADPTLPNTVGRAVVSWWGGDSSKGWSQVVSGGLDVVSSLFLDPTVIGGKVAAGARAGVLEAAGYGAVRDAASLGKVVESPAFADFTERAVVGKTPYEIYNGLLPNHPNGLAVATALHDAHAVAGAEGVKLVTRSMLGDPQAAAELASRAEDAAVILDNSAMYLDQTQEALRAYRSGQAVSSMEFAPGPTKPRMRFAEAAGLQADVPELQSAKAAATQQLAMAKRAEAMYGELDRIPRQTFAGRIRTGENALGRAIGDRSDWYQNSPYARPLHVVFDRLPKNRVNLTDPHSAVDLNRMLDAARLPPDEVAGWMDRYGSTVNGTERRSIFDQAEVASIKSLADRAGLSVDDVDQLLGAQRSGRASLAERMTQKIYSGNGRDLLSFDDADRPLTQVHMFTEGTAPDEYRLADFHQVRRVVTKWGQFKANHPAVAVPISIAHEINDVWRPLNLLKVSTSATIQMDQQLRIYMKLGALPQIGNMLQRGTRYLWDTVRGVEDEARGVRPFEYRGVTGPGPWGITTEDTATIKALNSSRGVQKLMDAGEIGQRKLFGEMPQGRTIYPTEPSHLTEMAKVLNNEIGDDAVNRMLLEGRSVDDVTAWLDGPEGQAYTKHIPLKRRDPRGWVESRAQHIEDMTAGDPELKALALQKDVKATDIEAALPDPATRPMVNRLLSDNMTGKSQTIRAAQKVINGFFRTVQSWPDDVLSRNTLYSELYDGEMRRLVDVYASGKGVVSIPDETIAHFSGLARTKALTTTKELLYDLADQSRAAEVLRFAVPFFEPVREQVTVFGQLIGEAPQRYARVRALLRAPLRSGLVFDEKGNQIDERGRHIDPLTGQEVPESMRGTRELLKFNLPSWTRGAPWVGDILGGRTTSIDLGTIRGKAGIPTSFGWGPAVGIPINQIARQRPGLEESLKFLLPYGVTDASVLKQLEPGYLRKFDDATSREDDNRTMRGAEASALLSKLTSFRQTTGRVPTADEKAKLEQEAIDEAGAFMKLRFATNYLVPFGVGFDSPYKPYADAYRAASSAWQEAERNKTATGGKNPTLADAEGNERDPAQWFLDTFGDEFYAMTQSVTKSNAGIPPTVNGVAAEAKYRDLIERYPDLGGLIIGAEGSGEFNHTVYLRQLQTETRPGSGQKQREYLPLSGEPGRPGISTAPEISQGWQLFTGMMDQLDAVRKQRGLASYSGKAAEDLATAKRAMLQMIGAAYPAWADEYALSDSKAWERKIEGLNAIAADKRLAQRPEIQMLGVYLQARQGIAQVLASRKSKTLTAQSNADVYEAWDRIGQLLVDNNLAFADLYHRYLENDPVTP